MRCRYFFKMMKMGKKVSGSKAPSARTFGMFQLSSIGSYRLYFRDNNANKKSVRYPKNGELFTCTSTYEILEFGNFLKAG